MLFVVLVWSWYQHQSVPSLRNHTRPKRFEAVGLSAGQLRRPAESRTKPISMGKVPASLAGPKRQSGFLAGENFPQAECSTRQGALQKE